MQNLAQQADKLSLFFEVASLGSIQAASRKLGLSAPTILYQINLLEKASGRSLFVRSKQGMELTAEGAILMDFTKDFFKSLTELEARLKKPSEERVHLRFGTFPSIAIYLWPDLLKALAGTKSLTLSLTTGRSSEINELLLKRSLDVALTVEGSPHPLFTRFELYRDHYGLFTHPNFHLKPAASKLYYLPDAQDEEGKNLYMHLRDSGLEFSEVCALDSLEVALEFAKKGLGFAILPIRVTKNSKLNLQEHKKLMPRFGSHRFYLNYRKDLELKKKDMDMIQEAALRAIRLFDEN